MKITHLVSASCFAAIFSLGYSISYASETEGAFLLGQYGSNVGIDNCPGSCNADFNGTLGMGVTLDSAIYPHLFTRQDRDSFTVEYSRQQFTLNGNTINVRRPSINYFAEMYLGQRSGFSLALGVGLGWQTTDGTNLPSRTTFDPTLNLNLLYEINPTLQLSLGYSHDFIYATSNPDFISNSVLFGLRWYL